MSAHEFDVEAAAAALLQARRQHGQITASALDGPQNAEQAYAIQERVRAALERGRATAWKVGTSAAGIEPSAAPIFGFTVLASPACVAAGSFHMLAAEVEIAFRVGHDLPPGYPENLLQQAIDSVIVAIELCDTRLQDFRNASAWWKLADNQSNYGLVLGSGRSDWAALDFSSQVAEFHVNGRLKNSAVGAHPLGTPFRLMPWIAAHAEKRSGGLRVGDIITTGAWTGMENVEPGDEVLARFPGIGEARVSFAR